MRNISFTSATALSALIGAYFNSIESYDMPETNIPDEQVKKTGGKKGNSPTLPEPATLTGLAYFLGFCSRQAFDEYARNGKFADILKRGRLRIEIAYEKKLHSSQAASAIFALKSMGWNEKTETPVADGVPEKIKIEIVETGPKPVGSEKEIIL
jgi:hypothetical protein